MSVGLQKKFEHLFHRCPRKREEGETEKIFKEIMAANFPHLTKKP